LDPVRGVGDADFEEEERRMSRRTLRSLWVAALTVLALALAACGGGDDDEGGGGSSASAGGKPSGTLTVWTYYDEGSGGLSKAPDQWKRQVEAKYPDVKLDFQLVGYDNMTQKLTAAAAAGKGPDIALVNGGSIPELVKAGAVQDIDEEWQGYADKSQFPAAAEDSLKFKDKRYAVQAYTNIVGLYYNKTMLDELGVKPPTNLDELDAAMAKAREGGKKAMTVSAPAGAGGEFSAAAWLLSQGWTYQEAGNPAGRAAFDRLGQFVDKKYISPADSGGFNAPTNFATGDYAFMHEGNWNLGTFKEDLEFEWGVTPIEGLDRSPIGGEVAVVGGNAKDKAAAWAVIEEMVLSKEGGLVAAEAGSVPLRRDVAEDAKVKADKELSEFAKIAAKSTGIPLTDNTGKVSTVIGDAFNQVVAGKIGADEAWQKVSSGVPPLMQES
jgi:multiple sugar transport system substrate-binding protein